MIYTEYRPFYKLRNYLQCIWVLEYNEPYPTYVNFLPDGYFDLLFVFQNKKLEKIRLIGVCDCGDIIEYSDNEKIIGFRFSLTAINTIVHIPINELVNDSILISPRELYLNEDKINNEFIANNLHNYLQQYFLDKVKQSENKYSELFHNINSIYDVSTVSRECGYSARHIQRIFNEKVGISPKRYLEIVMLREFLLDNENCFYDDAHKIKYFKKFTGLSPMKLKNQNVRFLQYNKFFQI